MIRKLLLTLLFLINIAFADDGPKPDTPSSSKDGGPKPETASSSKPSSETHKHKKGGFGVGLRLGAYGLPKYHAAQIELIWSANETFSLRVVGGGFYHYFKTLHFNNIKYDDVKLTFLNAGLVGDWYLFKGGFRFSGGIFANKNRLALHKTGTAMPPVPAFISDGTTVSSRFRYRVWAPYLGIGYDYTFGQTGFSIGADAGFLFQGKARARTDLSGPMLGFLSTADLDAAREGARLRSEELINSHKWLRTLPIITFGVRYIFR